MCFSWDFTPIVTTSPAHFPPPVLHCFRAVRASAKLWALPIAHSLGEAPGIAPGPWFFRGEKVEITNTATDVGI